MIGRTACMLVACLFAPTSRELPGDDWRIPITELPFEIRHPGSYVVAAPLTATSGLPGITISCSHVTIDLNGFPLDGIDQSSAGIVTSAPGLSDVFVLNGTLLRWSTAVDLAADRGHLLELQLTENGLGADLRGADSSVQQCIASNNGTGFVVREGSILECVATENQGDGFVLADRCLIQNCISAHNQHAGIRCNGTSLVRSNSAAHNHKGIVIQANATGSEVTENACGQNDYYGIEVFADRCRIVRNKTARNLLRGIIVTANHCSIDQNLVVDSGIEVLGDGNQLVQNSALRASYTVQGVNDTAPVERADTSLNAWANLK